MLPPSNEPGTTMQDQQPTNPLEDCLNAALRRTSTTKSVLVVLAVAVIVATASILFIFNQSWNYLSVGSITAPTGLEEMKTEVDPAEALQQIMRDRQLLDSIERFGIERMEQIRNPQN